MMWSGRGLVSYILGKRDKVEQKNNDIKERNKDKMSQRRPLILFYYFNYLQKGNLFIIKEFTNPINLFIYD